MKRFALISLTLLIVAIIFVANEFHTIHYTLNDQEKIVISRLNQAVNNNEETIALNDLLQVRWETICVGQDVIKMGNKSSTKAMTIDPSWSMGIKESNGKVTFLIFPEARTVLLDKSQKSKHCSNSINAHFKYHIKSNSLKLKD